MQVKKQQLEPDVEQYTGSKLGKEYDKAVYCHGGPARQHRVGVEVLADVDVTLHDGIEGSFVNAAGLHAWGRQRRQT